MEVLRREEGEKLVNTKPKGPLWAAGQGARSIRKGWEGEWGCHGFELVAAALGAADQRLPCSTGNRGPGDKTPQMSWSNICTTFPAFTKKAFSTQSTLGDELGRQSLESPLKLTL